LHDIFKSLQILPICNSDIGFFTSWYGDWALILTIQSLIPGRGRRFFPSSKRQTTFEAHVASYSLHAQSSSPGVN